MKPVFAQQQYFFQEEFNLTRPGGQLNPDKWTVYENRPSGCIGDLVKEGGGFVNFIQCSNSPQFPYIVSKTNPFPEGNFSTVIRFQYTRVTSWGTGIELVDTAPANGAGFTSLFAVGVWQDRSELHMRINFKDQQVYSTPINIQPHELKVEKIGSIYKLSLDNQLVFTSPSTNEKVRAIYMGNPSTQNPPVPSWTWFKVDFIRVTDNGPSEIIPEPFLDLPWDYKSQGKNLKDLIYNPFSWFDHKYPLQDFCCDPPLVDFTGKIKNVFYKSHSGYDYSGPQGVGENTPVLAAAAGWATFLSESKSGGAGNMIKIDHENGYQTWYEHLDVNNLVVNTEGERKHVEKGEKIGKVGLTGRTTGYHIHLSVFKDINNNGDFSDDYPFGLTDPLGWEGDYTDPWEEYTQGDKYGAKSYKLFMGLVTPKTQSLTPSGGTVTSEEFQLNVPSGSVNENTNFKIDFGPFEKASETISSIVPSLFLSASNNLGQAITNFNNPLGLVYDYSKADLGNFNEDTMSFYFFNEGNNLWEKLSSTLDKNNKTITSETSHFSQFAVMAELLDTTPPTTQARLTGDKGTGNWYRSNVTVNLLAEDNPGGKGFSYTVYSLNGENWDKYETPIEFNSEGSFKLYFLSHDNVGNQEEIKTVEFLIDKTIPEINITSPNDNDVYLLNQTGPVAEYSCTDTGGSGLQSCEGDIGNGESINMNSVGEKIFKVQSFDNAGNSAVKNVSYKIQYNSSGLCSGEPGHTILQPINPDGSSIFKQGSTIPTKFRVCHNSIPVSDPDLVESFSLIQTVSDISATTVNEPVSSTTPDSSFRFDPLKQQWIFNMNTKTLSAGKTYFYRILLNDSTDIQFSFGLR